VLFFSFLSSFRAAATEEVHRLSGNGAPPPRQLPV
jgi:hypothetical protein